jgi:hypothetical protein
MDHSSNDALRPRPTAKRRELTPIL